MMPFDALPLAVSELSLASRRRMLHEVVQDAYEREGFNYSTMLLAMHTGGLLHLELDDAMQVIEATGDLFRGEDAVVFPDMGEGPEL
ncbi:MULTISPECIES: hypothetical protein [Plantibacter]|nr:MULTISPECIES: hypothetical protein [Plantibacter]KQQ51860.1 hypothetical protein ASF68_05500 [Plantibacter sp. Leaf314]